jgi:hypothetical protein
MKWFLEHHFHDSIIGRALCLLFGHAADQVWLNEALGLATENPDRPGTILATPKWEKFGGGDIFLCPRCRVVFMPIPECFKRIHEGR